MKKKEHASCTCTYTTKRNAIMISTVVLVILIVADIIFQGAIYKRLPVAWQNKCSEWIGR